MNQTNLLDIAPRRLAQWEQAGDRVVLIRPKPEPSGWRTPFEWVTFWMAPRRLKLDEIGTFSWQRLDGKATVGEVASALRRQFGERAEPCEERVGKFVRLLRREQLVDFISDKT